MDQINALGKDFGVQDPMAYDLDADFGTTDEENTIVIVGQKVIANKGEDDEHMLIVFDPLQQNYPITFIDLENKTKEKIPNVPVQPLVEE